MHTVGVSPYSCSVEGKKKWDPQGFANLSTVLLISVADHIFILVSIRNAYRSPLKFTVEFYCAKSIRIKVMAQQICPYT